MRLEIDVNGDVQFARELLRFRDRADDMRPAFREIADDFLEEERSQFMTEGRHASGGWQPLNAAYRARKIGQGHDPRILHRTLRLRRSLTMSTADSIREISRDEMFVGTRVPYAVHHQHGAPRANVPRRRPVELTRATRVRWIKILQRHLVEGT